MIRLVNHAHSLWGLKHHAKFCSHDFPIELANKIQLLDELLGAKEQNSPTMQRVSARFRLTIAHPDHYTIGHWIRSISQDPANLIQLGYVCFCSGFGFDMSRMPSLLWSVCPSRSVLVSVAAAPLKLLKHCIRFVW